MLSRSEHRTRALVRILLSPALDHTSTYIGLSDGRRALLLSRVRGPCAHSTGTPARGRAESSDHGVEQPRGYGRLERDQPPDILCIHAEDADALQDAAAAPGRARRRPGRAGRAVRDPRGSGRDVWCPAPPAIDRTGRGKRSSHCCPVETRGVPPFARQSSAQRLPPGSRTTAAPRRNRPVANRTAAPICLP